MPTYEKFVELEKIKVKKVKIKTYKKSTLIHNEQKD